MHFISGHLGLAVLALAVMGTSATAQATGHGDMNHALHQTGTVRPTGLTEPGQGAFAALSEIVSMLEADPATDWQAVDLTALRIHLIDMDRLVRDAVVEENDLQNGLEATVTGDPATLAAIKRMVPAHAGELSKDGRWQVAVQDTGAGVLLTVTSADLETVARIQGLGFFGLMASQDHHRAHHMAIALGEGH